MTISQRMAQLGAKGGRKRSAAKQAASRANAAKARAAAAEKRVPRLPDFDGERSPDLPRPPAKNDGASHLTAPPHEPPSPLQLAAEPIKPEIVSKATPAVNHRWPPWPRSTCAQNGISTTNPLAP